MSKLIVIVLVAVVLAVILGVLPTPLHDYKPIG